MSKHPKNTRRPSGSRWPALLAAAAIIWTGLSITVNVEHVTLGPVSFSVAYHHAGT